jgi:uncharacterized protein YfcZ (UPF0381/DUF406 family)
MRTASGGRENFASREEAESTIAAVRERALAAAASEPPQVDYTIVAAGDEAKLEA